MIANFWLWQFFYDYFVPPGDGVIGSALLTVAIGIPTYMKKIRPHFQKIHEIHRHLDPNDPFEIGKK